MCPEWKKHRNWVQFFSRDRLFFLFVVKRVRIFAPSFIKFANFLKKFKGFSLLIKQRARHDNWRKIGRREEMTRGGREERGGVKITHDSSQYTIFLCIVLLPLSLFVSNAIFLIWIWSYMYNNRKIFISFQYFTGKEIRIYVL